MIRCARMVLVVCAVIAGGPNVAARPLRHARHLHAQHLHARHLHARHLHARHDARHVPARHGTARPAYGYGAPGYGYRGAAKPDCRYPDGTPFDPDIIGGENHVGDGGPAVNLGGYAPCGY